MSTPATGDSTVRLVERLTRERDDARAWAVALEQQLARVGALVDGWTQDDCGKRPSACLACCGRALKVALDPEATP